MHSIKQWGLLACVLTLITAGCAPNQNTAVNQAPANSAAVNSNAQTSANAAQPDTAAQAAAFPVTMPLIDAMFSDENFAAEAKRAAQLTDEESDKIRDAARDAVLQLSGDAAEDDARSTRASVEKTQKEVEKVIGPERTVKLFQFIRSRWAGTDGSPELAKPNSVPTDSRVVVNAAAYRMDVFKDGQLVKSYRVGIGYPEFPLPVGLRKAEEIIFNPEWTPPDEPWVKGKVSPGKTVEAGSKLNPLGTAKIPIGLPSLIHGGKAAERLGTFASHGCVGLTDELLKDFALQLSSLGGAALTVDDIKQFENQKTETKNIKLTQAVPVELRYETIVASNGNVTIFRDFYERGTNSEENLRKVLEVHGIGFDTLPEPDRAKLIDALGQMAVDAEGDKVDDGGNTNSKASSSSKVTRNIKGKKEIVVPISALQNKGYPEPVGMAAAR